MWKNPRQWSSKREEEKKKNTSWNWKGERVEEVKEILYLGINLQRNGDLTNHIKERMKRANVVMKQVWGIGERKFQDDFKRRLMFDCLVVGVMLYGVELFG